MSERLKTLREQRSRIVTEMQGITEKAQTEKRDLTSEELSKHAELFGKVDNLRQQIEAEERQVELNRQMADLAGQEESRRRTNQGGEDDTPEARQLSEFRSYLRTGVAGEALRALQAGSDPEGGHIVAPPVWVAKLIQAMDSTLWIRNSATVHTLNRAASMGAPSLDTDLDDAEWTSELSTGSDDDAMKFGKRELTPHPCAKRVKVSKKLLRVGALPIEGIIMDRLRYKFGVTQEKAYLLGNGNKKPLGVFVASNDGIPTSRDVSAGNTATAITFNGVIEAKYALKAQYWPNAQWVYHRDVVKELVKLKDQEGQYIWRQSVKEGEPDTLLGRPIRISDFAPNTFAASQYVGIFGDFSYYWICTALDLQVQYLRELYAEKNQDGFIGRLEEDGMPVLAEAFSRVTLAAS